jgi:large subunit ribosomal protein L4
MLKVQKFTSKGTKVGQEALPKEFDQKVNITLLAQAIHVFEDRAHVGLRKTKTRAEVERTTKKVYKQKGTGGARHGSRRANLFVGGGVALGPRPEKRVLTMPLKMRVLARFMALNQKAGNGELILVTGLSKLEKTGSVLDLVTSLKKVTGAKRFTFILSDGAKNAVKFFRNLQMVKTHFWKNVNAYDVYNGGMVVLDSEIFPKKTKSK